LQIKKRTIRQKMPNNKISGDAGEREIVTLVPCPNCAKPLMTLPPNYPLYDMQCTGCSFRVQVKTNNSKPKSEIFGAGWDIMDKVLKSGFMIPPLIANFKWEENGVKHQKILFYPFIPKSNIKKRQLSSTARRANYKMFNYVRLEELPCFLLYER
jgi:hypothetical protein